MKPDSTEPAVSPEYLDATLDEFPEGAGEFTDPVDRRRFLGLMSASIALATGAGCNIRPAPQRKILPYTTQPDQITPGVPLFFASAAPLAGFGTGVLVRSNEGRPTKVEGNPDHPSSLGGVSVFALGSILDMYDPDRSRGVTHRGLPVAYENAVIAARNRLYDADGRPKQGLNLRILTETVTSPTLAAQIGKLLADFPAAMWVQHDPAGHGNVRDGNARAFGKPVNVTYNFNKADVVLSLDSDFLSCGPGACRYSREFGDRRKIRAGGKNAEEIAKGDSHKEGVQPDQLNRLYAVEVMPTATSSVAEHRLSLPAGQVENFARALAAELGVAGGPSAGTLPDAARAWLKPLADDLKKPERKGKTVVVAGEHQSASLHALAHAINSALGNVGQTVFLSAPVEARPEGKVTDLKALVKEMAAKQVDALFVFGSNPAYTAPQDVPFKDAIKNVGFTFHLGTHQDETAVLCEWHVNEAHYLEAWGDIRGHDGTVTIQQPLIAPLYLGKSAVELIADVTAGPVREGLDVIRAYWRNGDEVKKTFPGFTAPTVFDVAWQEWVRGGVVPGTASPADNATLAGNWAANAAAAPPMPSKGNYEINFRADPGLYDGRFANNGWLLEWPRPVTKMTWDNAAYMSQQTARELGLPEVFFRWTAGEHGRAQVGVVELKVGNQTVKAPAWVLPGHADGAITVHLGFGRKRAGQYAAYRPDEPNAEGEPYCGFDAYKLRTADNPWFAPGLSVTPTNETYFLACTQGYTVMTQKDPLSGRFLHRDPVRHGTLAEYKEVPWFPQIPPVAAGETREINENVPGPRSHILPQPSPRSGAQEKQGNVQPKGDDKHEHNGKDGHDKHGHESYPLTMYYPNDEFSPNLPKEQARRWAMAMDMSACTGCSACVVACVSENNTPVVGKNQVTKGRAMHWLRIDRYYVGVPDNHDSDYQPGDPLQTLFQPVACVQCEKAPCEVVCPVGATVHSTDGLNDMAYNRCVGTRYCSNNCPYKVRRFNFLTYADWDTNSLKLGRNPDVSVRSRGVMEKCTFCVQRIRGAEIVAEREHRAIRDGEILTACQAACPSGAIVFGDMNDADSRVSDWKREPHNYGLLAELNTMPRMTHLAAIRNPNPAMPGWQPKKKA